MRKLACLCVTSFFFATFASAQIPTSGNVFVGYSYESASSSALDLNLSRNNLQGWEASLEGKVAPLLGIVADFGGHYGSQTYTVATPNGLATVKVTGHEEAVMFGPRVSVPIGKYTPFGEAMIGLAHISTGGTNSGPSDTSFATALGGGIDYRLVKLVALRFEGDYVTTRFFHATQNNIRLSTGVVFRF